jgi:hypothetical protein
MYGVVGSSSESSVKSQLVLLLWEIMSWDSSLWGRLAGSNVLLCQHRPIRLMSKGWAPRTKGSHLYPCKQVTEAKSKAQPTYGCMWLHWLFHFLSAMWLFHVSILLSFISLLCHPLPLSCCQNTSLSVSFLPPPHFLLHHSPLWCSDSLRVKEHHLDLGVCISIASLHAQPFSFL